LNTTWEVTLGRGERKTFALAYSYTVPAAYLLRWCAEVSPLSAWGTAESVRIEFRFPQYTSPGALLQVDPPSADSDGRVLAWNYENASSWTRHELLCYSPDAWAELLRLSAAGAHHELARLLVGIQESAEREQIAHFDRFDQIVAELQAALGANPNDTAARLELAQLYSARAEAKPDLRLNYLLLAAQELAAALERNPGNSQIAEALSLAYYHAATVASESGDPAGALAYLRKARSTGAQAGQDDKAKEELVLRWALSLAEQGQVSQAMAEIEEVLSPEIESALLRYAPPYTSVRTEVELGPRERLVRSSIRLYPPTASKAQVCLQEISARLNTIEGCQTTLELETNLATLELRLAYRTLDDLKQRSMALIGLLAEDPDLISALILVPWQGDLRACGMDRGYWLDRFLYREWVDLRPLQEIWEAESQYVRWRLVELRSATPADERAQLERRFALIALREQLQLWENLPTGSYWIYRLRQDATAGAANMSWLVGWNQARELTLSYPVYHWTVILQAAALAGAILLALLVLGLFRLGR